MARETMFLIDGSSQMYRAYHAFRGRGLSNQEGQTTHAVYVFVTMLRKLIADHKPTYLAASFDLKGRTFRDDLAADYKANRAAMPDELAEQINWVHQACEAMGVPIITAPGFEADDVIGTLALKAQQAGFDVAMVTIDKDFFQLVRDGVRVWDPREDGAWFDEQGVVEKFGVKPSQVWTCWRWSGTPATTSPACRASARRARLTWSRSSAASTACSRVWRSSSPSSVRP
jgi:DNA polymerase-1